MLTITVSIFDFCMSFGKVKSGKSQEIYIQNCLGTLSLDMLFFDNFYFLTPFGTLFLIRVEKKWVFSKKPNPPGFFFFLNKQFFLFFLEETTFCSFFKENGKTLFLIVFIASCKIIIFRITQ